MLKDSQPSVLFNEESVVTKPRKLIFLILIIAGLSSNSYSGDNNSHNHQMQHEGGHHQQHSNADTRISLNLPPQMKLHQLANMRAHVEAVRAIVGLVATSEFENASKIAHSQLGLTEEMEGMCNAFENEEFKRIGMAFHKSGDVLGDVLSTKDMNKSLIALRNTMNYCVECHATFRQ